MAQTYTNSGYFLLTLILERVSGERTSTFMKRRIFDPLGMTRTVYRDDPRSVIDDRVTGYRHGADGAWRLSGNANHNVFTTLEDLVRWNRNFVQPVVGGAEAIHWMTTWGKLDTGQTTEWGLGLSPLRYRGLEGYYFSGGGFDGTSVFVRFPEQKFGLIVLCNGSLTFNAEPLGQQVVDIALPRRSRRGAPASGQPPSPQAGQRPALLRWPSCDATPVSTSRRTTAHGPARSASRTESCSSFSPRSAPST